VAVLADGSVELCVGEDGAGRLRVVLSIFKSNAMYFDLSFTLNTVRISSPKLAIQNV